MSSNIFILAAMLVACLLPQHVHHHIGAFTVIRNPLIPFLSDDYTPLEHRTTNQFSLKYQEHINDQAKQMYTNSKRLTASQGSSDNPPQSHCRCTCVLKPDSWHNSARSGRRRKDGPSEKKWLEEMSKNEGKSNAVEILRRPAESLKPSTPLLPSSSTSSFRASKTASTAHKNAGIESNQQSLDNFNQSNAVEKSEGEGHSNVEDFENYAASLDFSSLLQNSDVPNRYEGHWEENSRYPYLKLRDDMCYRQPCKRDKDCCRQYNLCDKSAFICIDCWYGQNCKSEKDCCLRFPICSRRQAKSSNSSAEPLIVSVVEGRCVDKLPKAEINSH